MITACIIFKINYYQLAQNNLSKSCQSSYIQHYITQLYDHKGQMF